MFDREQAREHDAGFPPMTKIVNAYKRLQKDGAFISCTQSHGATRCNRQRGGVTKWQK